MARMAAVALLVIKEIFRKKDFYVALIVITAILFYAQSLKFYNVEKVTRYFLEMGMALSYYVSVILCVGLAARQIPTEIQNRTLGPLLAKPITRFDFIGGKLAGVFLASCASFGLFFFLVAAIAVSKGAALSGFAAFQAYFLFCLCLLILSSMSLALSLWLTPAANMTVSLMLFFLMSLYGEDLKGGLLRDAVYFAWPHFEFFDIRHRLVHGWPGLSALLCLTLAAYAFAYSVFFALCAYAGFRRRPVS